MELLAETPCTYVHLTVPKFFDLSRETCNTLTSPEFRFAGDTYCFRFRANGDTADTDLELVRLTFSIPERTVSYSVGHWLKDADIYPKNSRSLVGGTGLCITRSALEEKIYWYVIGGTLRLPLFLRLEEQSSTRTETSDAVQKLNGLSSIRKLQSDYRQLLQKGTESDACVVVQGTEFKVHKNVLRARSAVFEAMFGHDMAKKETGRVVIDDLDPECFKAFLEYLYTGEVQGILSDDMAENRSIVIDDLDLDSVKDFLEYLCTADLQNRLSNANAFGLYAAADKYDVSTLKSECVEHMRQTLSVDSFCDVVTLALLHDEKDLLQQSIRFFKDNMQGIVVTAKWQQFMCDNPKSANELIIKAIVPGKQ